MTVAITSIAAKRGSRFKDISGQRFGRLVVMSCSGPDGRREMTWECVCDCGGKVTVTGSRLRLGVSRSCGCLRRDATAAKETTHGMSYTPIFNLWEKMVARCNCPSNPAYHKYGGRGIKVCQRWMQFENFFADMGHRPPGKSLDRIDNDGDYSPENCRWATAKEQSRNKRTNKLVTFNGKTMCIAEWAEHLGMKMHTLYRRLCVANWPVERALTTPTGHTAKTVKLPEPDGA